MGAHPRSRGATALEDMRLRLRQGPSPLTRGNLPASLFHSVRRRPIPAHAGQPTSSATARSLPRAHPRSRGATCWAVNPSQRPVGPSPLTRGNRQRAQCHGYYWGPIPAHAGQPPTTGPCASPARAHPRSRGATHFAGNDIESLLGPSPLTRGNREHLMSKERPTGPIPAHAGQPQGPESQRGGHRAHPRSRGATGLLGQQLDEHQGPSPLTRGNRQPPPRAQP